MVKIDIKPLSVNEAWQGKRFKSPAYKKYERDVLFLLPKIDLPKPPFKITFTFAFSNSLCDFDNPVKPLMDILQKKYGINDRDVTEAHIYKIQVPKGKEYSMFKIEHNGPIITILPDHLG